MTWFFNRNAGRIGVASFVAFLVSSLMDHAIYAVLANQDRRDRVFWSNIGSSLTDSVLFLSLAFGWPPSPEIVFGQFTAKVAGAALWARIVRK